MLAHRYLCHPETLDNHDDTLSDFRGGSQAPSSLRYDSGTPAAYWSSRASSPVSDFSSYSSNFGDMSFTAMLNAPLPYFPTAVPSGTCATQYPAYPVPYSAPTFNFPEPSLFEAPQAVVPRINHSSSSAYGLQHPLISNQTASGLPHLTPSNVSSGAEHPQVAAPNANHSSVSLRNSILLHIIIVTLSRTNLHFTHTVTLGHARRPHVLCMSWSAHRLCRYIRRVAISLYFFIFGIVIHHSH